MLGLVFIGCCVIFFVGYHVYGRRLSQWLGCDPERTTPAHELNDNVDYVPTFTPVLFGHHYSSIAGAGPIVGPILAGLAFGWLPALIWVLIGSILIGGVHDYSALMASVRHRGRSIGDVCRQYLTPLTYRIFLAFVWLSLVYVLIVFLDLTAAGFAPAGNDSETLHIGGSVATSSMLYIGIALAFGFSVYRMKLKFRTATLVFLPLVFLALVIGYQLPLLKTSVPALFYGDPKYTWTLVLLIYCYVASITPVWVLLQPRDYLSSFLLFACLVGGGFGLVISGFRGDIGFEYPAFLGWRSDSLGYLFPALFITVACGAVSGFHAIVSSGTTAKQLNNERDALPIAYGSMLIEGVLAVIALSAVIVMTRDFAKAHPMAPGILFAKGIGRFTAVFGIATPVASSFGLLAVSTFLLTTLDTATRLSRFILEEFFGLQNKRWRFLSTLCTLIVPAAVVFIRVSDGKGGHLAAWRAIWPAFGASNQLLAALTLLVIFAWLTQLKRRALFVLLPMLFMLVTTVAALVLLVYSNLFGGGSMVVGVICLVLLVLAVLVVGDSVLHWSKTAAPEAGEKPVP